MMEYGLLISALAFSYDQTLGSHQVARGGDRSGSETPYIVGLTER